MSTDPNFLAALRRKREFEKKMGLPVDAKGDATRAPTEEELGKLNGFWSDKRDDYRQAVNGVLYERGLRDYNLNRAIALTKYYVDIGPHRVSGLVRHNADSPNLDKNWFWRVRFSGSTPPQLGNHNAMAWISPDDGGVNISLSAFESPAQLAFAIAHEAMHYNSALNDTEFGLLASEEDIVIYSAGLANSERLGLSAGEFKYFFTQAAGLKIIAQEERRRIAQGQPPKGPHVGFGLALTESGTEALLKEVDADLSLFDITPGADISPEGLEQIRASARSEFIRGLSNNYLHGLVKGWHAAKSNDQAAAIRQRSVEQHRIASEAGVCGFRMADNGDFFSLSQPVFRIYHGGDTDRAKAAFLLINACLREGRPNDGPCNDAIGIVFARWGEPRFKDSMMKWRTTDPFMDGVGNPGECLLELRESWTPRGDFADLKATIERNYTRRVAAQPKPPLQENPREPREPRPPRDPAPPPTGGGQCYWSNDGREICP